MKHFKNIPDTLIRISGLKRALSVLSFLFLSFSLLNGQTADFTASSVAVCEGSSIIFTDASTSTTGTVNYDWDFGTGATPATATGIGPHPVTYSTPGTITVSLTITDDVGSSTKIDYITVNPNATIALTSGSSSNDQTICILSLLTPITYQVSDGGTGAAVTGLPTGIAGNYSGGVYTISGTPTQSGTFNYTVTTTGTCTQTTATGTIRVIALPTANAGPVMSAICQDGTSAPLGGGVGGSATGGIWSDGGIGGVFSPSATDLNATWSPPATYSGTATLTLTTTGGPCGVVAASKTIIVNPLPTASAGPAMTAICQLGTSAPLGGNVGGSATGGIWSDGGVGGVFSPSASTLNATWTPPAAYSGIATLTLTTTGGSCGVVTALKSIRVNPNATIALISGIPSTNQTICFFSPLSNITYQVSGGGTGANVTGLPTGITGSYSGGVFTISGTPTQSGTFNYTVTTTGTCAQTTATGRINVIALPVTTATSNSPVCEGETLTLTGGPAGMSSYSWTGPDGFTSSAQSPTVSTSATLLMSGDYTLTVTNSNGCVNSATTRVMVNPLPAPVASSNSPICETDQLQLSGSPNGMASYSWTGPNGFTSSAQNPIVSSSATLAMNGVYTLTVTNSNGCVNSASTIVAVNPLPSATISGTATACKDDAFPVVTFSGSGGTPPYTFTYSINGGPNVNITSTGNSVTVSAPTGVAGIYNYNLISVRDASVTRCLAPVTGEQATITINPLPTATIDGSTTVCQLDGSPDITFTGSGGTAPYIFTYSINSGTPQQIVSVGSIATLPVPTDESGIFTYSLLSVSDASETTCSQTQGGSATVTVNALPEAVISGSRDVCQGSPTPYITFTGSEGRRPYTFTYRVNGEGSQTISTTVGSSVSVSVPTSAPGTYQYELISVRDGSSTACEQPQSGIATIVVNPLPQATIGGTTTVCRNDAQPSITFTGSNGTAPYTFTYTVNSGPNQVITTTSGNSVTLPVSTGATGTFTYSLVSVRDGSSTGCSRLASGTATITVLPLPTATIGGTTAVCRNAPSPGVTFTGYSGTAPYTFIYTINGGGLRSVTSGSGNSVTIGAPTSTAGVFDYELVSVSDGSSRACSQPQTGHAVITVNPLPVASITGTTAVCQFSPEPVITFTGSEGTAPYIFTYSVNNGGNQTVVSTGNRAEVAVSTDLTGVFSFDLVSVRDASSTSCIQTVTGNATVTVNTLPTATISGSVNVCQTAPSPQILFTGSNGTAPYTFTYSINGGGVLNATTTGADNSVGVPVVTTTPGTFTYELISVQDGSSSSCRQPQGGTAVVRVNPLPQATITGTTQVCRNEAPPPVTFTGSGGTAPYIFTYTVNGSEQVVISTGNVATVNAPTTSAGVFTYELLSVQDASSTACVQAQTGEVVITVNELPVTSVITGNPAPPCEAAGQVYSVTLTPGSTYIWSVPEEAVIVSGATGPGNNSITVNFGPNNGNIGVTEINANGCAGAERTLAISLQGCDLNPNFTVNSTSVCSGSPVIFTDLSSGTTTNTTYEWNFGAGAVPATANTPVPPPVTYTGSGTRDVSLTLTDGVVETELKSDYITINPLPSATISGTTAVCENAAFPQVQFTGSLGTPPYTFTYTVNGSSEQAVTTTSGSTVSVAVPTTSPGSYLYRLVSVRDGSSTACERPVTGTATVTVNPLPSATMTGTTTVCSQDIPPLITFTGSGGTTPYTFSYRVNGGGIQTVATSGGSSTATLQVSTQTVGTFTYELLSVHDGTSTACAQPETDIAVVTVNPLPTASISGTTAVCRYSESPNITFTGASGTPPYIFTYSINSGPERTITTVLGSSVTLPVPTSAVGGFTYSLIGVQDRGGAGCAQSATGGATVIVNPLPTATLTGTTVVCEGDEAPEVTFTGANGTEPYIFTYRLNGGNYQTIAPASGSSVTIPVPTGVPGTYSYELVSVRDASSTTCSQVQEGEAVVIVNPRPMATISGTATVCRQAQGTVVTLTGSNGTPPYTFTYNINSGVTRTITTLAGESSVTIPVPTGSVGTYTYSLLTVSDASITECERPVAGNATITVLPLPTATIAGTTTVCAYDAYPEITFTGSTGSAPYTFIYNINGGGDLSVTTTGTNSVSIAVPTETSGVYSYQLVAVIDGSANACANLQEGEAIITIRALPTATITGGGILCHNDPLPVVTFTGSGGVAPYTFTYTLNGGDPQTIATVEGSTVTVEVPTDITGTFEYELLGVSDTGNPDCSQAQSGTALFIVNPLPEATIRGNNVVCRDDPAPEITFRGSGGTTPYTFTYTINGGAPVAVSTEPGRNSITITAPTAIAGDYIYELVSVRDGSLSGCSQQQEGSILITVDEIPVANAGSDAEICGPVFQLNAIPDIGSGVWSMVSGTGSASFSPSIDDPNAVVTVTQYGLKQFTWTEFNGVCSDDATIEVMFWEMPEVDAGADGESCDLRFDLNATPGIGTGRWRMTTGTGTATFYPDVFAPDAVVEVTQYGTKRFTWTGVNGTCTASDVVEVTFYRQPVANPGTGGNNCGPLFNLRAIPSYGTGRWTLTSGPGNVLFTPDAGSPTATVEVDQFGTYEFTWTEVNGSCSDFGTIGVTFIEAIPANGGEGGSECDLDFVFNATPVTDNGFWSKLSGPGTVIFDPSHNEPDATVTVDQYGRYEFGWTELNVVCQSTDVVVVEFHEIPAVSTIQDTVICKGETVQLITAGEGDFLWAPAFFLDSTDVHSPSAIPDSTLQYIVTLTDQYGCRNQDSVVITVMEQPVANAGPDQILDYTFNAQLEATLGTDETGTWSIVSGEGTFRDIANPQTMIEGLVLGNNLLQWIVSNGVCPDSADQVSIIVNDLIIPTLITPNGDHLNEYFELRGIETLGVTQLIIFDRGGTQVYKSSNYANDWNGVDQHGNPLPEDTYFFVMQPRNGTARSGYIVIRR